MKRSVFVYPPLLVASLDECSWSQVKPLGTSAKPQLSGNVTLFDGGRYQIGTVTNLVTGATGKASYYWDMEGNLATGEVPLIFKITGAAGGKMKVRTSDFDCTLNFGPFPEGQYIYSSADPVDFYNSALQMAGGSPSVGEYYLDIDKAPIHLRLNATTDNQPSENWMVVASGAAAHLLEEPSIHNPDYVPATTGKMITSQQWIIILDAYINSVFAFYISGLTMVWLPDGYPDSVPYIGKLEAHPYGQALMFSKAGSIKEPTDAYSGRANVFSWAPIQPNIKPPLVTEPTPLPPTTTRAPVTGSSWIVEIWPVTVICLVFIT